MKKWLISSLIIGVILAILAYISLNILSGLTCWDAPVFGPKPNALISVMIIAFLIPVAIGYIISLFRKK